MKNLKRMKVTNSLMKIIIDAKRAIKSKIIRPEIYKNHKK